MYVCVCVFVTRAFDPFTRAMHYGQKYHNRCVRSGARAHLLVAFNANTSEYCFRIRLLCAVSIFFLVHWLESFLG